MISLTVVSETKTTLTLAWTPVPQAIGYEFYVDGVRVSNSWNDALGQVVFGKPDSGEHTYQVIAVGELDTGSLEHPAVTPPPVGWTVAPPQPPVTTINNPAGIGVNLYQATSPLIVQDTIVNGGGDSAYLIQPGAPGRTLSRCQANNVAAGNAVSYGKHAVYAKASGITVVDFSATASKYAANGLSVRFAGFLGQRCQLDGFPIPLAVFADDTSKGTITWRQIKGAFTNTGIWLDVDEAAKMVYDIVVDQVALTGSGKFLAANSSNFAGTVKISASTLNGKPVTAADVQGVPASALSIS